LVSCVQFRADKKIRQIAEKRNDNEILAIASDELIAKEAHHHASCYRVYTKMYEKKLSVTDTDDEFSKVWEMLLDILKILELKNLETYETCMESSLEKRT